MKVASIGLSLNMGKIPHAKLNVEVKSPCVTCAGTCVFESSAVGVEVEDLPADVRHMFIKRLPQLRAIVERTPKLLVNPLINSKLGISIANNILISCFGEDDDIIETDPRLTIRCSRININISCCGASVVATGISGPRLTSQDTDYKYLDPEVIKQLLEMLAPEDRYDKWKEIFGEPHLNIITNCIKRIRHYITTTPPAVLRTQCPGGTYHMQIDRMVENYLMEVWPMCPDIKVVCTAVKLIVYLYLTKGGGVYQTADNKLYAFYG